MVLSSPFAFVEVCVLSFTFFIVESEIAETKLPAEMYGKLPAEIVARAGGEIWGDMEEFLE